MHTSSPALRHRTLGAALLVLLLGVPVLPAFAQNEQPAQAVRQGPLLMLRPHCVEDELPKDPLGPLPDLDEFMALGTGRCRNYATRDPHTQTTEMHSKNDNLHMDLILFNPDRESIGKVRAWISYDAQILEGTSITMNDAFPILTPGEADFNPAEGTIQIGIATDEGKEIEDAVITVAEIRMRVKDSPQSGSTPLVFQDIREDMQGHTYAIAKKGATEKNILPAELGTLLVMIQTSGIASSGSPSSSAGVSSSVSSVSSSVARAQFSLLQVQNLRATTDKGGSTIYTAWDHLRSSELAGYNLYYGTEKGRYIQRHSVLKEENTHAIRGLVPGTIYYIAVRAVSTSNEESTFSNEVMITVGNPGTSTSPLNLKNGQGTTAGKNPLGTGGTTKGTVPGESGSSSTLLLLILASGVIGTVFAFRRQLIASPSRP